MSGGSYDYGCFKLEELYVGAMYDDEMNEMMKDLYEVLHDVEWWQSSDIGEDAYRTTVEIFKKKWFGTRDDALRDRLCKKLEETKLHILER